ncbi:aspartate carbamoyltransferase catalytic subunit [Aquicoccus sp. SCR17]|nr:aspartate carbamoyltransferase catalytic subunit [Carideicomes alvinocaridis]
MKMEVKGSERGLVRVFALALPKAEAAGFVAAPEVEGGDWPLRDALGATALDPDWVDLVHPGELDELGVAGYLTQGLGVAEGELDGARDRLGALTDPVVILPSQAFAGTAQTLTPRSPLRWIGTFQEESAAPVTERLHSDSAKRQPSHESEPPAPEPASSRPGWLMPALIVAAVVICLGLIFAGLSG